MSLASSLVSSTPPLVFPVIHRHLRNSINAFIEALDENMQRLNNKKVKAVVLGEINIDLNSSGYTLLLK